MIVGTGNPESMSRAIQSRSSFAKNPATSNKVFNSYRVPPLNRWGRYLDSITGTERTDENPGTGTRVERFELLVLIHETSMRLLALLQSKIGGEDLVFRDYLTLLWYSRMFCFGTKKQLMGRVSQVIVAVTTRYG